MKQSRRIAPRVPYDEAVALTRFDGRGRLYARALDLSVTGIHVMCSESCPLGTELRCTLLLPGGPRNVRGRVVRETVLRKGLSAWRSRSRTSIAAPPPSSTSWSTRARSR